APPKAIREVRNIVLMAFFIIIIISKQNNIWKL
ncbi:MAG: hypothetical protein ACI9UA_005754, partial [Pseudoalteromonas tetraodonis]